MTRALVFLASLAIDLGGRIEPDATTAGPPPAPPAPPPPPRSTPAVAVAVAAPAPRELEPGRRWALSLATGAHGGLASALRPAGEVGVSLESARPGAWAPMAQAAFLVAGSHLARPEGEAWSWLFAVRARLCPVRLRAGPISLRPCVGVEAGAILARGSAIEDARQSLRPWLAPEATLVARASLGRRLFLEASGGAAAPVVRTRYMFRPAIDLYETPPVTFVAALGAGWLW